MSKSLFLVIALSAAAMPLIGSCRAEALVSAPVDYSLYKDGEVQRSEHVFASWLLTCDEIHRLRQKFCSLRSVARSVEGTIVASVAVSTDERGRPAALVTLPFGTSLKRGVNISYQALPPGGMRGRIPVLTLQPSQCEGLGCQAVWPFSAGDLRSLLTGKAIYLSFDMTRRPSDFSAVSMTSPSTTVTGTIGSDGFAAALKASMR